MGHVNIANEMPFEIVSSANDFFPMAEARGFSRFGVDIHGSGINTSQMVGVASPAILADAEKVSPSNVSSLDTGIGSSQGEPEFSR